MCFEWKCLHPYTSPGSMLWSLTQKKIDKNTIKSKCWQRVAHLRETLKPKTLSYSFMSFFSRVLFPAPEGPLNTTGLGPAIAAAERRGGEVSEGNKWVKLEPWHISTNILWHESLWDQMSVQKYISLERFHKVTKGFPGSDKPRSVLWDKYDQMINQRFVKVDRIKRPKHLPKEQRQLAGWQAVGLPWCRNTYSLIGEPFSDCDCRKKKRLRKTIA